MSGIVNEEPAGESAELTVCRRLYLAEILNGLTGQERALVQRLAEGCACDAQADAVLFRMRERLRKQGYSVDF